MSNDRTRADLREANARLVQKVAALRAALVEAEVALTHASQVTRGEYVASAITAVRRALGGG